MYSDNKMILNLISLMKQNGILNVVISPGSRHYPLIRSLEADPDFKLYSIVDERSAAFFALGLIQQTGAPAAVCCTSGTSAANYSSAVVEAFYQGLPLVILTADRLPALLNQKEEQMLQQHGLYDGFIRYQGQLPEVRDAISEWHCNRIINEAFLELDHYDRGPVHLNFPIETHHSDKFETATLPTVRRIFRITADDDTAVWQDCADRLAGKKVMIVWGQSTRKDPRLESALQSFAERCNCMILSDKLSNSHGPRTIEAATLALQSMTLAQSEDLMPDVIITMFGNYTFNGSLKSYLKHARKTIAVWDIGTKDVIDPFRKLKRIFETREAFFFEKMSKLLSSEADSSYHAAWAALDAEIKEPEVPFGEIYAVGALIRALPQGAKLNIANSLPIRMAHLFRTDPSVIAYCNRGVNGIDGCMSSAVGVAAATDDPVFLIIGDLTFFYDMNALWNRHLSRNLRILLVNNAGGGVMHMPLNPKFAPELNRHVSSGHVTSPKGWVESIGFRYFEARDAQTCDDAMRILADPNEAGPIMVEAFSLKEDDVREMKAYMSSLNKLSFSDKVQRRLRRELPKLRR